MSEPPNQPPSDEGTGGASDASWPQSAGDSGGTPSPPGGGGSTPPGGGSTPPGGGGSTPPGRGSPPPPPPAGGSPPPPAPGGRGPAPSGGGLPQVDVGNALNYGWAKFQEHLGPILIGLIGLFLAVGVIGLVWQVIVGGIFSTGTDAGLFAGLIASAVGSFVFAVGGYIIQAVMIRAGFDLVDGRGLETSRLFDMNQIGPIVITGLLISIGTTIGYILCFLPGLVFAIVSGFSLHYVVDQGKAPVEAITASINLIRTNPGQALLLIIVTGIVAFAGAIACGVGLLVTVPVALIAQAYGFRQLNGQPVPTV